MPPDYGRNRRHSFRNCRRLLFSKNTTRRRKNAAPYGRPRLPRSGRRSAAVTDYSMPSVPISFPPPRGTKPGPFSGEGRNRTPRRPPRRRRRTQNGLEKSGTRIQRHLQPSEAPPSPPRGTKPLPRKRVERTDPRPTPQAAETVCGELRRCNMLPVPDSAHPPGIPVLRPRPESGRQKPSAEKSLSACGSENRSGRATRTTRSATRNGRLPASHPAAAAIPQEKASQKNGTGNAPASECPEPEPPAPDGAPEPHAVSESRQKARRRSVTVSAYRPPSSSRKTPPRRNPKYRTAASRAPSVPAPRSGRLP